MYKTIPLHVRVLAALTVVVFGLTAYASLRKERAKGKCDRLNEACRIAGFKRGHSSIKLQRYYATCIKPMAESGTLEKLGVSPKDIQSCARRWDDRMKGNPYAPTDDSEEDEE